MGVVGVGVGVGVGGLCGCGWCRAYQKRDKRGKVQRKER